MAENTNYIGVAMGLDVTDLKAGLSAANKQIQLANAEFRSAASEMDDWTKSSEGLTAKVKQLDTVLSAQKSKLKGLQAEYEKVAREQGENSEAAQNLKVQLKNQEAVVNKTERELENYRDTLKQVEEGTLDLESASLRGGKAIASVGDGAEDAGGKMGGFGGAVGGVIGVVAAAGAAVVGLVGSFLSLAESTRETRVMMGKLESQFTTAGNTAEQAAETYSNLYGVFGDTGKASEAAAFLGEMAGSQKELDDMTRALTGTYAKWGDAIAPEGLAESINHTAKLGEVNGTLADGLEWAGVTVDEFNAELAKCNNEQERQELIVGKLNDLYGEQADAYNELNKDVIDARKAEEEMNLALAELGAIAEPIMTSLKNLATDLLKTIQPFVALIGEGLRGVLDGTAGSADKLSEGLVGLFDVLAEKVQEFIPKIIEIALQIAPKIIEAIHSASPQIMELLVSLATMILENLPTMADQITSSILSLLPVMLETIFGLLPGWIQTVFDFVGNVAGELLPSLLSKILELLPVLVTSIIDGIVGLIPTLITQVSGLLVLLVSEVVPNLISSITTALPKVINSLIDGLLGAIPLLFDAALTLLFAVVDAIPVLTKSLFTEIPKLAVTIITSLLSKTPDILSAAFDLLFSIILAIPEIVVELTKSIPDITEAAISGLMDALPDMLDAGADLLGGLVDGMLNFDIKGALKGLGGKVVGALEDVFDMNSPSKLIEDKVGVNVGAAIVPNSKGALSKVKKRLDTFSDYVTENLGGIKAGLTVTSGMAGGGSVANVGKIGNGGYTVVNAGMTVNYNGKLSRKQLKQNENDHYTAVKTRLKNEGAIG